jgi:alpha-mannosidase
MRIEEATSSQEARREMHDDVTEVRRRVARLMRERIGVGHIVERLPFDLAAWVVPGEPVPVEEALAAEYAPIAPGDAWGRPWGTTWLRVRAEIPAAWRSAAADVEVVVDLGFNRHRAGFQAEGLLHDAHGVPLKAINPRNAAYTLPHPLPERIELYLEAASNPDFDIEEFEFVPTELGDLETAGDDPLYRLAACELVRVDRRVWELAQDVQVLEQLLGELPADGTRAARIVGAFAEMLRVLDPVDLPASVDAARAALAPVLRSPAVASAHRIVAVGHAHIDSAWLWPVRETIRKCARTFSNVLDLMDADPEFVFACSSAQQYLWMRDGYPAIWERIRERVREGRWIPVGGMWVESDTNLPGGEALVRQFVEGTEFFRDEFELESDEVWLPDSFGYSGALPQIARSAGKRFMLTQKMSWNDTNDFPHHTFRWEGNDGSSLFTHLPPVDTYGAEVTAKELVYAERNFRDKRHASISLVPYGYSDGGGGPTREMIAAAKRFRDLEGAPKVELGTPADFFRRAEAELADPSVWIGEMYLEGHRGSYTSQARVKRGNRRVEHLLREAEWWLTTAAVDLGRAYPAERLRELWRELLLLQFHDILPGTAIAWVHREAEAAHQRIAVELEALIAETVAALAGPGDVPLVANPSPFAVAGVPGGGIGSLESADAAADAAAAAVAPAVRVERDADDDGGDVVLDSGAVRVVVDGRGFITSLRAAGAREFAVPGSPIGCLHLHRDIPSQWDAWDIERHYRDHRTALDGVEAREVVVDADGAMVRTTRRHGASVAVQTVRVRPGSAVVDLEVEVDWHERDTLLKLAMPLQLRAEDAVSETQFGHVRRATHANTTWDHARFETVAHRWVHVGEPGAGVAVANDSTYGYDIGRTVDPEGRSVTTVGASLVRGSRYPDPDADQGRHRFRFTLRPDAGIPEAVEEGYALNLPTRAITGGHAVAPLVETGPGVVIESLTLARDGSGDVIVRLYEAFGASVDADVSWRFPSSSVRAVDLHEAREAGSRLRPVDQGVRMSLRPFELVTLRIARASDTSI